MAILRGFWHNAKCTNEKFAEYCTVFCVSACFPYTDKKYFVKFRFLLTRPQLTLSIGKMCVFVRWWKDS